MKKAFEYSSLFEWHFWDDAYKMIIFRDSIEENKEYDHKNASFGTIDELRHTSPHYSLWRKYAQMTSNKIVNVDAIY